MKVLENVIRWTGDGCKDAPVILTQLRRVGQIAMYMRTREATGRTEGYEVIRIRVKEASESVFNDRRIVSLRREVYPSANDFGPHAKFCTDLKRAEEVFGEWVKKEENKA